MMRGKDNKMYTEKVLKCRECGAEFLFTAGEQEFYARQGFMTEPTRCRPCRSKRKRREQNKRDITLYEIVCAKCGEVVMIPVRPTPERPAYCGDCYRTVTGRK